MKGKKTFLTLTVVAAIVLSFSAFNFHQGVGQFKYIGVTKCVGACHKSDAQGKQLDIWKNSKHSMAYKTLETPEADKIAQEKGFQTKAAETPNCLKCHVLGKDMDPSEFTENFDMKDGVQCESCHGPGSEYKSMSIMKDKQKSIENGLILHSDKEVFCKSCHNPESPTFKEFEFEKMWNAIKHTKP
jgi:excinuclease UvrABC ATPase subunit